MHNTSTVQRLPVGAAARIGPLLSPAEKPRSSMQSAIRI
jgi:hypothetical protein